MDAVNGDHHAWAPIVLDGTVNTRDIGGLATAGGKTVRRGLILRSDGLRDLSKDDVDFLVDEIGIRAVFDLRSPVEVTLDGVGPLGSKQGVQVRARPLIGRTAANGDMSDYTALDYDRMFHEGADHVAVVLSELAGGDGLPAIVHCTAGKDRTGIVIAVLLELLGVPRSAILADYRATAPNLPAIIRRTAELPSAQANPATPDNFELSSASLTAVFEIIDKAGGVRAWLVGQGASPAAADALIDRLLV